MKIHARPVLLAALVLAASSLAAVVSAAQDAADRPPWDEARDGPLPRWREGGTPPVDPGQSLRPFALQLHDPSDMAGPPTSGLIESPPEYAPCDGAIFRYATGTWSSVVTDCVAALTGDPGHDEKAWVVVASASQQAAAVSQFTAAGADMGKVVFQVEPTDSIWLRDYGPHFIWQDGALAIVDSHYYPTRPRDNFIPTLLADDAFVVPPYPMGLYYSGGNFQPGPGRSGFVTSLVQQDNPGFGTLIQDLYRQYQGIDTLHVFPRLPGSVDGTGHIDMWLYLVDEDTVVISEFKPGSHATAIQITNDAVPYMQGLGFTVFRVPAWNAGSTHYTYTNAYRVNDRIFVPTYGEGNASYLDEDADALAAWQAAAGPGVEVVGIDCYSIIPAAGAIHCIMMQVPRFTGTTPAAHVVSPDGGELLAGGAAHDIRWAASDDVAVTAVELAWSDDGGVSFPHLIAGGLADDGHHAWTVPHTEAPDAVLRVRAGDGVTATDAFSAAAFEICDLPQAVYDFSVGAGVDRWGWGDRSTSWSEVSGSRHPAAVSTPIDALKADAYADLAASDAGGGDADPGRYISATPTGGAESTHVFEFTLAEPLWTMRDIGVTWEGYGDDCLQVELYVWDHNRSQWGDGAGRYGENAYMANFAGNRDERLEGHIRGDFGRYVDLAGRITLLVYAERSNQETFHDHLALTVTHDAGDAGPWTDLGHALAGTAGTPALVGQGTLVGGSLAGLDMTGMLPSSNAILVIGLSRVYVPLYGGTLVPFPDLLVPGIDTGPFGAVHLEATWPLSVPSGSRYTFQTWVLDAGTAWGWSSTNAVEGMTP